jgi:ABC-type nitrate/sulfonate/bicarbonate transport system ATPase subunit
VEVIRANESTASTFLCIESLSVSYPTREGPVVALSDTNLAFPRGSFVTIVGPSGCGKTTLLQAVGGFIRPTSGHVMVDGTEVTGPGRDRGMVFQQPALFPWMSVERNAELGLTFKGASSLERRRRTERYLRMVGLWDFRSKYPYQLSGGMQQRLAIARVLVNDPMLLLMDEPFGALDALTREQMQEELRALWRLTPVTVLFVTHSVEEAVYLGTHVVVMSSRPGRVVRLFEFPFAREASAHEGREIKASGKFVRAREEVLDLILRSGESSE